MYSCFFCEVKLIPGDDKFTILEYQGKVLYCCNHKDCVSRRETLQEILPGYSLSHYGKVRKVSHPARPGAGIGELSTNK